MSRLHTTAALLIFGLATPLLTQALAPMVAVARANSPDGAFGDREWTISVYYQNNAYTYSGYNYRTDKSINLSGATVSGDNNRRIYTWNNSGTRYQVTWQRRDPDFIRVRVMTPSGKEVLNRLLARQSGEGGM
jgi:uncharacterized protein (DUF58 family)